MRKTLVEPCERPVRVSWRPEIGVLAGKTEPVSAGIRDWLTQQFSQRYDEKPGRVPVTPGVPAEQRFASRGTIPGLRSCATVRDRLHDLSAIDAALAARQRSGGPMIVYLFVRVCHR